MITCSSERDADRERSYVRLLRSMRAAAVDLRGLRSRRPGAQRGDGPAPGGDARRRRGRGPPLAARGRRAGRRASTTRRGSRRWSARWRPSATGGSRSSPVRGRCTSPATAWTGYRRGLASRGPARSTSDSSSAPRFDRDGGAAGVDTLLAGERAVHRHLLRQRPARAGCARRGSQSSAIAVPGDVSVAGFDDISVAAMTAPALSTVALPLREMGRRGFARVDGLLAGGHARGGDPAHAPRPAVVHRRAAGRTPARSPRHRLHPLRHGSVPMSLNLRGLIPACVVTFDADGRFDEAAYRRYLQWLLPQGPVALAINADTGEGPHLWPDERERVLRVAVDEAGDIPVIAGLSAPVHGPGRRGGEARGGCRRPGPARVPDPGLPGHAAGPRDPGRVPRGDRPRLRPAPGRVPAPAGAGRRGLRGGDAAADRRHRQRRRAQGGLVRRAPVPPDAAHDRAPRAAHRPAHRRRQLHLRVVRAGRGGRADRLRDAGRGPPGRHDPGVLRRAAGTRPGRSGSGSCPLEELIFGSPVRDYRARTKVALRELGVIGNVAVRPPLPPDRRGRGDRWRSGRPSSTRACSDGGRAGRSGRAGHRQQPRDRRRGRGQGRRRGRDGRGPLPPLRRGRRSDARRGCAPPARTARRSRRTWPTAPRRRALVEARHRAVRARRRPRQQRRAHAGRARSWRSSRPTGTTCSGPTSRPPSTPAAPCCRRCWSGAAGPSSTSRRAWGRWASPRPRPTARPRRG